VTAALKGVPSKEPEKYRKSREDCLRCGRPGHRTYDCFPFQRVQGIALPPAPWKVAAVETMKRRTEDELEEPPLAKQLKVAAVEEMPTDPCFAPIPSTRIFEKLGPTARGSKTPCMRHLEKGKEGAGPGRLNAKKEKEDEQSTNNLHDAPLE